MHWALSRRDTVRVTFLEVEAVAATMQQDTGFWRHYGAAETGEQRIDEGNRVTQFIDAER